MGMSGHSKWSTIKHKKAAEDSKRGKVFGEVARMIRVAVKAGKSGDPNMNPALRIPLEKARAANMPKENIDRAIARGLGKAANGAVFEEVTYEGFGPGGVGFMVFAVTDNRNRSGSAVRTCFERHGGSLSGPGAASYLFSLSAEGNPQVKIPLPLTDPDLTAKVYSLVEALEELDDVEVVVSNMVV